MMERLQAEGVRGADLIFACIGPALEIFSRYSRVETAEGERARFPEHYQCAFRPLSKRKRGEAAAGRNASGTAKVSKMPSE